MTLAEPVTKPIFGPITVEEMRANEALTRLVLRVVGEACKHSKGRYSAATIAQGISQGEMKLWGVLTPPDKLDAAVVTRVNGPVCEIIVAGPDFDDVLPFMGMLKRYAKGQHCERMSLNGPYFFRRQLPGWKVREVRFECDLAAD